MDFRSKKETPTEPGDYVIFNQCDGYHIVECEIEDGAFCGFRFWMGGEVLPDFYCAWAKLPESSEMYDLFAVKPIQEQQEADDDNGRDEKTKPARGLRLRRHAD